MKLVYLLISFLTLTNCSAPDGPRISGSKKLDKAGDCNGPVAFSAIVNQKAKGSRGGNEVVTFDRILIDKSVGYSRETGIFTTHCPGLYQFAFGGSGDEARFSLRKRPSASTTSWHKVITTGKTGASQIILLDMEVGEQAAVFHDSGSTGDSNSFTFSGLRVAKK